MEVQAGDDRGRVRSDLARIIATLFRNRYTSGVIHQYRYILKRFRPAVWARVTVEVVDALPQILGDRIGRFEVGIVQCGFLKHVKPRLDQVEP